MNEFQLAATPNPVNPIAVAIQRRAPLPCGGGAPAYTQNANPAHQPNPQSVSIQTMNRAVCSPGKAFQVLARIVKNWR